MLDFTNTPVIDAHGHPFLLSREKKIFAQNYAMCIYPWADNYRFQTSYHMVLKEYRRLFGMPLNTPDEDVVAERQARVKQDYKGFVKMIYEDCGIKALISDFGFPIVGEGLSPEEFQAFYDAADGVLDIYDMIRIETTCDRFLYKEGLPFDQFLKSFDDYVEDHIRKRKTICMKSVVGYYTGLKWEPVTYEEAEKNYKECYIGCFNPARTEKKFRDFMVYHGLELAVKHGMNFQMHTGAGDPPKCDIRLINPNDLYELINTDLAKKVNFVLCHGGFPYSYECAILAACYPHVFCDISSTQAYGGRAEEPVLRNILDLVPHNKIMFAADAGGIVDGAWYAACYFKKFMAELLNEYVEKEYFTEEYAKEVGEMILYKNAKRIYGI